MNDRLDQLLSAAAPSTAQRSKDLQRELTALVTETEAAASSRERARRVGIVTLAVAGVLSVGGAAAAAGWVPLPWFEESSAVHGTHRTPAGEDCQVTFAARELDDRAHPVKPAERAEAYAESKVFLRDLDMAEIVARTDPAAAQREIENRLSRHLAAKGLSTYAVGVAETDDCSSSPRSDR